MPFHYYVDWNGLAAMLANKRSAGVTPEVSFRILLYEGDEAHPGFETQGRPHQKSKTGHHWLHKWTNVLQR